MQPGKRRRLARLNTDDRYVVIPMDHGITLGAVEGLADIESTIEAVTRGGADAVLTQKGIASRVHPASVDSGYILHLNASTVLGPDSNDKRVVCEVEEALRHGADAVSFHLNVGSNHESDQFEDLARITREADRVGVPVLVMAYARGENLSGDDPEHDAENLAHAVRVAEELGADFVKTAYSDDQSSFQRVTAATRLPVLIAGGTKGTDHETLSMVRGAMDAGAAGVSMGRSVFQHRDPEAITAAIAAVVHDDAEPETAIEASGLATEN